MGAGRPPKCKICGKKLSVETAYMVVWYTSGGTKMKAFYCSQEEYNSNVFNKKKANGTNKAKKEEVKQKEKKPRKKREPKNQKPKEVVVEKTLTDRDYAYGLICEIIGRQKIINTILWKEWKVWNEVASDTTIKRYLSENKEYLCSVIARLDNIEYNRIRYLSAVIKNKIGDFASNATESDSPKVQVDETFYAVATRNNRRRSLADLEDEY